MPKQLVYILYILSGVLGYWNPALKLVCLLLFVGLFLFNYMRGNHQDNLLVSLWSATLPGYSYQYLLLLIIFVLYGKRMKFPKSGFFYSLILLLLWVFLSYFTNQLIEFNLLSLPFFILSFFLPIILVPFFYTISDENSIGKLFQFFQHIVLAINLTCLIQIILGYDVDSITGGTKTAHMVGFLNILNLIVLLYRDTEKSFIEKINYFSAIPFCVISDSKYHLVFGFLSIAFVYVVKRLNLTKILMISLTLVVVFFSANKLLDTKLYLGRQDFRGNARSIEQIFSVFQTTAAGYLWTETFKFSKKEASVSLYGTGPGTFLSRASNSRAFDVMSKDEINFGKDIAVVENKSNLPSFIKPFSSWALKKYVPLEFFQKRWYGSLFDYRSSILSIIWEIGFIGFFIFLCWHFYPFYLLLGKRFDSRLQNNLVISYSILSLFYFLIGLVAYYFEYTDFQILYFASVGVFFKLYESNLK